MVAKLMGNDVRFNRHKFVKLTRANKGVSHEQTNQEVYQGV